MKLQKETKGAKSDGHGKWYDDACGTAFAMELVGERWSLLIVRELMFGGRRFSDLRGGLPGISAKVLTERLEGLERAGIVQRRQLPPPVSARVYELTALGYGADQAIMALGRWAASSPRHDPTLPLSPASFMLSLRTMFDASRWGEGELAAAIEIGAESFVVEIAGGRFTVRRGELTAPGFILGAPSAPLLAAAVYRKVPLAELANAGVRFAGDASAAGRFIDCFHLPEKVV